MINFSSNRGAIKIKFVILAVVISVVAFGGYTYFKKTSSPEIEVKTQPAMKKTLRQTVSAPIETGAPIDLSLNFESSGKVTNIYVAEGDVVKKGELLAKLDNSNQQESLKQASSQAQAAGSAVSIAQANTEMASAAYSIASSNKKKLETGFTDNQLAVTEAQIAQSAQAISDAKANLDSVEALTEETESQAELALELAEEALDSAEDQYAKILVARKKYPSIVTPLDVAQAKSAVEAAEAQVEMAEQSVETTKAQNEQSLTLARAQVNSAQGTKVVLDAQYDLQTAEPSEDDMNIANQSVNQANAQMKIASAQLSSALSQQEIAESQRLLAVDRLSDTMLITPTDGMIVEINNKVGELLGAGSSVSAAASSLGGLSALTSSTPTSTGGSGFMTLIDFTNIDVVADVDETDISKLKKGLKAIVNLDAFSNAPLDGIVTGISKLGRSSSTGGRIFETTIRVTKGSYDISQNMTGDTDILLTERKGAIVVPFESILGSENDRYVYVVRDGVAKRVKVKVGITNDTEYEVLDGIKDGDNIVVQGFEKIQDGIKVKVAN